MSVSVPILLVMALCLVSISAALYFAFHNARKRAAPESRALDLGGRLPAKRRRPCGRHGGDGNCDDCEHGHERHDHDDGGCSSGHCQK